MSSAAYVIIKQNEYIQRLRKVGAVSAKTARPLTDLNIKRDRIFSKMEDKGVFRPGPVPETFYLDECAAEDFLAARRRRAFYMMLLVIIVAAIMFFLSRK